MDLPMDTNQTYDYSEILEGILTRDDVLRFIEQLGNLEQELFHSSDHGLSSDSIGEVFGRALPYDKAKRVQVLIHKAHIAETDIMAVKSILDVIKQYLQSIPVATVTLAFEPNLAQVRRILQSITQSYGKAAVLQIVIDPSIVGGMVLEWEGKYHDYSIKKKVKKYFEAMRREITS